jgi:hypothetical protein
MQLSTALPFVALVIVVGFVVWLLSRPKKAASTDVEVEAIDRKRAKLMDSFYEATSNGEPVRNVARIYSQTDIAAIASMLSSEGIAIVQLNPNMNVLRTGVPIQGLNDSVFVVLERDYAKAKGILQDYILDMSTRENTSSAGTIIRNVAETAIGGVMVNSDVGRPEIL